eukprot:600552-Pleurochrysis_carterae.AAC.3
MRSEGWQAGWRSHVGHSGRAQRHTLKAGSSLARHLPGPQRRFELCIARRRRLALCLSQGLRELHEVLLEEDKVPEGEPFGWVGGVAECREGGAPERRQLVACGREDVHFIGVDRHVRNAAGVLLESKKARRSVTQSTSANFPLNMSFIAAVSQW